MMSAQTRLTLLLLGVISMVRLHVSDPLYPSDGTASSRSDDGSSPAISLRQSFVYFGNTYNVIYVNHNGHLTFSSALGQYVPPLFPSHSTRDIIAPLWTDLDNRESGSVLYKQYTSGNVLRRATREINTYFPSLNFVATWALVATWKEVAYYSRTNTSTTVQAVLVTGTRYSFVLFKYGEIAQTSHPVQVGYDTINSTHYSVIYAPSGSRSVTSYLNLPNTSNVRDPGCYAFRVDEGSRGCTVNGTSIELGDSFWDDQTCTRQCTCTPTGLQCERRSCSFAQICRPDVFRFSCQTVRRRTCTIAGDPHYYTFDGTVFHFQGTCAYVLSESCGQGVPYYRVEGKNEHRGSTRVSWTRGVKVYVYGEEIELVKDRHAEAKVNGSFTSTPASLRNDTIQIYQSGFSVVVTTDFGLVVTYDASHLVKISVPYDYQNKTCGLCGNFNNRRGDDFRTRQGQLVTSDIQFANSWKVSENSVPGCDPPCIGRDCISCTAAQSRLYGSSSQCGRLSDPSGPFARCHSPLPHQNYVESCVYDLCVGGGYQPILCKALNVYATECPETVDWRRGICEITCPANSHYEVQGTGCPATCSNPNSTQNCRVPNQEACICDTGYVLSAGVCVPLSECGCTFEGQYYSSGQSVILGEDCSRQCTCRQGSFTCRTHSCGPLESCSVEDGRRGCRPISYSTCWVKGSRSYLTFDGLRYQYPGACRLILARVEGEDSQYPHFVVTAEKIPRGLGGFDRLVRFEAEGVEVSIEIGGNSTVHVDGEAVALPYSRASNQIRIYHRSLYGIVLQTALGVTVHTDWPHLVRVTAPGVYNGSLGGLCGNYNGDQLDEFLSPAGVLLNNSRSFGDSWRDGSLSAHCEETVGPTTPGPNTTTNRCGILANSSGPFAACRSILGPSRSIQSCVEDVSESPDPAWALCEVLRDFTLSCQKAGVTIGEWRNITGCAKICPANSHYELCGASCPATCPSLSFPFQCTTVCQEGCQCDEGFLLSGNRCVPTIACGCHYEGRYREDGEQFWRGDECQTLCTCNGTSGSVQCGRATCGPQESCSVAGGKKGCHPRPHGTCSASGDPHYLTIDGRAYDFQGTCRYTLATVCNATDGLQRFKVEAKNEAWRGFRVSTTAKVFVDVGGYSVVISRENRGLVEVDGINSHLPILLNGSRISIYTSGLKTLVTTDFGLIVSYDGWSTVSISVPSIYRGKICGLCGNFNGNRNDDFITPSGAQATTALQFGTSWKVPGNYSCSDGCGSNCPTCSNPVPARAKCEVIRAATGPLSFCREKVDPTPYFNDCVYDVCLLGNQDVLCQSIQTYVSACQSANVHIYPWRQETTCEIDCPANSHYELCGTDCGRTCASSIDGNCEHVCSEGCFCDKGFLLSGGRCVPTESCGCLYDGYYYEAGETFWTAGCSRRCTCHGPNSLVCHLASCTAEQRCEVRHGRRGCYNLHSICTVWGDPHYITFDGALAHFQGTCSYIISKNAAPSSATTFEVVATNDHRGNNRVSFVSAVDIHLSNGREAVHVRLGPNKIVKVNGSHVSLPVSAGPLGQLRKEGTYVVLNSSQVTVEFDGRSTLLVKLAQSLYGAVTGLCGNNNGDPADDKALPNGTVVVSDNDFGHGWKSPASKPGCGATDEEVGEGLDDCDHLWKYNHLCGIITNTTGPFRSCHAHSDPRPFFTSCVLDLCLYTKAHGTLCSAVSAYEKVCSSLGLYIPQWRAALHCAESDPCEDLGCVEHEWCGEKDGIYGCFCDEQHHRPNNDSYDSSISCVSSSANMSLSRCQLFEAGFHPEALHLKDSSCQGVVEDGRLEFRFDNDALLCGTVLKSNGTHFIYENVINGDVDTHGGLISRERRIYLPFCCQYPLHQSVSMDVCINPIESVVSRKLPLGTGVYKIKMIPYQDSEFRFPYSGNISIEVDQRLYVAVRTEGVDERQLSTVLDTCWATPVNEANHPVRWNLIEGECPNPEDGTVKLIQNGISIESRFSFRMFTFTNYTKLYLHCRVHLCLLRHQNCTARCYHGWHHRARRDVSFHDTADLSIGPLSWNPRNTRGIAETSGAPIMLVSMTTLMLTLLKTWILS